MLKPFSSQRLQADSDFQKQLLPCKSSLGKCLLILNLFFLSQDLESYVVLSLMLMAIPLELPLELMSARLITKKEVKDEVAKYQGADLRLLAARKQLSAGVIVLMFRALRC